MKIALKKLHNPSGLLAVVIVVILLVSCSSNNEKTIIGEWAEIDGDRRIEFSFPKELGIDWIVFIDGDTTLQGRYTFVDKDRIELIFFSITAPGGTGTLVKAIGGQVTVSGDELTLVMPDGDVSKFKQVKQTK